MSAERRAAPALWPPPGLARAAVDADAASPRALASEQRFVLVALTLTLALVNALGGAALLLAASALQVAWALALVRRDGRVVRVIGGAGALVLVALWLAGHLTGLPLEGGGARAVDLRDGLGLAVELSLMAVMLGPCGGAVRRRRVLPALHPPALTLAAALVSVALAGHHAPAAGQLDRFGFPVSQHAYCGLL